MRRIRCFEIPGSTAQDVMDEFHEARPQMNILDADIISVCATPITAPVNISGPESVGEARVKVTIFYWADE